MIVECHHCHMRVLPSEGICPSCRKELRDTAETDASVTSLVEIPAEGTPHASDARDNPAGRIEADRDPEAIPAPKTAPRPVDARAGKLVFIGLVLMLLAGVLLLAWGGPHFVIALLTAVPIAANSPSLTG